MRLAFVVAMVIAALSMPITGSFVAFAARTASPDSVTTKINDAVTFDVLANDPAGTFIIDHTDPAHGSLTTRENGRFSYLPDANYIGSDVFSYSAQTGDDAFVSVDVTIEVTGEVTSIETRDDHAATDEDTSVLTYVMDNDGLGPTGLVPTVAVEEGPSNGGVEVQGDGSVLYTPKPHWSGTDTFSYSASDASTSDQATVTITVASVSEPPDAVDDAAFTTQEIPASIDILANDSEADGDAFTLVDFAQPLYGTVTWSNLDRMMIYEPNDGFWGSDQFTYTISDIDGADTATVTVVVNGVPVAQDDLSTVEQSGAVQIPVLANDSDPEAADLIVANVGVARNGTVVINPDSTIQYAPMPGFVGQDSFTYTVQDERGNSTDATVTVSVTEGSERSSGAVDDEFLVTEGSPGNTLDILSNDLAPATGVVSIAIDSAPEHGTVTLDAMQVVTYVPDAEFSGQDSFTYSISDGINPPSAATVSIEIQPVNDLPVAAPDAVVTDEDTEILIDAIDNDADSDGDVLEIESVTKPASGTARITRNGAIQYTPADNYAGLDSFDYVVSDEGGGTATSTVTITVNPVNDAPTAADDPYEMEIDGSALIDVLLNDEDPDGPLIVLTVVIRPSHGSAALTPYNTIQYLPDAGFEGYDKIEYQFSDGYATDVATVAITVGNPNSAPVAKDDRATTGTQEPVAIQVLKNDKDADGDALVLYGLTNPEHGTVAVKGDTVEYTPNPGFVGSDSFTYKVRDNQGGRDRGTVKIDVRPAKDRKADEK